MIQNLWSCVVNFTRKYNNEYFQKHMPTVHLLRISENFTKRFIRAKQKL